jgi:hypothetical protein
MNQYLWEIEPEDESCDHDWELVEGDLWRCKNCGVEEVYDEQV